MYIEIDGIQHLTDPMQLASDLMRDFISAHTGFFTIRIPNSLFKEHHSEIGISIIEIVKVLEEIDGYSLIDDIFKEKKTKSRPWTKKEDEYLIKCFRENKETFARIGAKINRTRNEVQQRYKQFKKSECLD